MAFPSDPTGYFLLISASSSSSFRTPASATPVRLYSLVALMLLLGWDASGLDLWMARLFGSVAGFPAVSHWFWRGVMHEPMRNLGWLLELALLVGIFRPFGPLKRLPLPRRLQLALAPLVALVAVSGIKLHTLTSCPWDLKEFGGVATHVSHWALGVADGGNGGCFPAGHASAGFAFVAGFFVFRHTMPRLATRWLLGALCAGLLLGLAQQVRGAHFMSHTLWTAWICWVVAAVVDAGVSQWIARRPAREPVRAPDFAAPTPLLQPASHG
jgi:membrane-associated PAP2 superfamily phosphatase